MARVSTPTSPHAAVFQERKVLIVDDEVFIRNLIKRMLNKAGVLLTAEAADVKTAADGLKSFKPDAIILDINMPGPSGLHLLRAIRAGKTAGKRDLPIIILTSLGGDDILSAALNLDADSFVSKGEGFKNLEQRLLRVFSDQLDLRRPEFYGAIKIPDFKELMDAASTDQKKTIDGDKDHVSAATMQVGDILPAKLLTHGGQMLLAKDTVLSISMLKRISDIEETFGLRLGT